MNIVLICNAKLPVYAYGGTERVVWDLAQALSDMGHRVHLLAAEGTTCRFAEVSYVDRHRSLKQQIPDNADIVHFHNRPDFDPDTDFLPYLYTQHGNETAPREMPINSVFVSENHARRFGSEQFVYNGLDWTAYGEADLRKPRQWLHFLGNAAWKVKNLRGAIQVARDAGETLAVLGGHRLNFKRGFRFTLSPRVKFFGMVGGQQKIDLLKLSRGLVFPVIWDEPFGLAVIESLYFGCPVFASTRGSLPELVNKDTGFLSNDLQHLSHAVRVRKFDSDACHERAKLIFNAHRMAEDYLQKYQQVIAGQALSIQRPLRSPMTVPSDIVSMDQTSFNQA
ncbi:MAG: glycosyltransferase family 4 protein [Betaproteobacteria bacterium]|nr:glycosyltransferase family 4 protein [Betaproteobacteria bacterium]